MPGLLQDLLTLPVVIVVAAVIALLVGIGVERIPVAKLVDHIFHAGARHRLAKKIARRNQRLYRRALQHTFLVRRDAHFVLRLLVLLDMEAGPDLAFSHMDLDPVITERGPGGDRHIALDRAHGGDGDVLALDGLAFRVVNLD